jgi:quercetin dioxygenase-like cupin family protein
MFRPPLRWFVLLVVLLMLLGSLGSALAQDATPTAESAAGPPEGVESRSLASGSMELLAPGTANVVLGRVTLAPGASIPFDPTDPTADLVHVTAGTLTFRIDAPMTVARSAKSGTPVPTEPEEIAAGTQFTMSDGDSALFPPNAAGEVRNDGAEDAVALVTTVAVFPEVAATPTP